MKRTRKKPVEKPKKKKKEKKVWYLCHKTLKDGNGKVCFYKGQKYLRRRIVLANNRELKGLLLASEVWPAHLVHDVSWGQHFTKVEKKKKKDKKKKKKPVVRTRRRKR